MKHFEVEEIARFAEGKVNESERERFITHLAECGICFKAYADTVKYLSDERKNNFPFKFAKIKKIKKGLMRFWHEVNPRFLNKKFILIPTVSLFIIALLIIPYLLTTIHKGKIFKAQIQQIITGIEDFENQEFSPAKDKTLAAFRTGLFFEDLILLVDSGNKNRINLDLKERLLLLLQNQIKIFFKEENPDLEKMLDFDKKNRKNTAQKIHKLLQQNSMGDLFHLGRFVESSILSTFNKKNIKLEEIGYYEKIALRYQLPIGVYIKFKKLKSSIELKEKKKILLEIKEIVLF